jgi:hypothetical protein
MHCSLFAPLFAPLFADRLPVCGRRAGGQSTEPRVKTVTTHRHNWQPVTRSRISLAIIVFEAIPYVWERLFLGAFQVPKWYNSFFYHPHFKNGIKKKHTVL